MMMINASDDVISAMCCDDVCDAPRVQGRCNVVDYRSFVRSRATGFEDSNWPISGGDEISDTTQKARVFDLCWYPHFKTKAM